VKFLVNFIFYTDDLLTAMAPAVTLLLLSRRIQNSKQLYLASVGGWRCIQDCRIFLYALQAACWNCSSFLSYAEIGVVEGRCMHSAI